MTEQLAPAAAPAAGAHLSRWPLVRLVRPRQRIKNGLVLAAPAAAGDVSMSQARTLGIVLLVVGVGLGAVTGTWEASAITGPYVVRSTADTAWLKHVPVVGIAMVTAFFVIRAVAGVAGTDIPLSVWYLVVASFGALFVVAGKRTAEQRIEDAVDHRASLAGYTPGFLPYVRAASTPATPRRW